MNNQIKLNAGYEDARKVAECYPKATTMFEAYGGATGYRPFIGIYDNLFVCHYTGEFAEYQWITIDTSKNQPCIYMCMKHGLTVEVDGVTYDLSKTLAKISLLEYESMGEIKSIKILGLEKMEGVEV